MDPHNDVPWFKRAFVYAVDVHTFQDSDGDGVGDLGGVIQRLDYLEWLGVDALWLLPFYTSPGRDNGYDVTDYRVVDPRLGTLDDLERLVAEAHGRGLRVILDLVVNHTSDQHPWFQAARRDRHSPYREYYVWTDDPAGEAPDRTVFPGVESGVWTWDERAEQFYLHHFYAHEPDLNTANLAVQTEILAIMDFWLDRGVDGFRMDAAPFFKSAGHRLSGGPHALLKRLRARLMERRPDGVLLAEADGKADELAEYFGRDDEVQLMLNFWLDSHLFLALARERAEPLERVLTQLPRPPRGGQWLNFLRNLDELDLERLTAEEQEDVYRAFAPEPTMRVFGRGTRRRLAPPLAPDGPDGDRRRLELALSLLLTLPGTPMLVYGDEIGLGEDLRLAERASVRTPMQWSDAANAGFSKAPPERLIRPLIDEGPFAYERVNVARQRATAGSLLSWLRGAIHARRRWPAFGSGRWEILESGSAEVFAYRLCDEGSGQVVVAHNLSREPRQATIAVSEASHLVDLLGGPADFQLADGRLEVEMAGYSYRWLGVPPTRRGQTA